MADKVKAVFLAALDTPTDRRPAYLDRACGGDTEVRRRVEALLRAHEGPDRLLDRPAWRPAAEQDGAGPGPAADPTGRAGRVQLLGEIARGGMGAVLRGHDPELGRELAVKVILPAHRDNPELVRRFIGEARLAGQLQHPGIVPVYDVGRLADGRPFFAMKLIRGRTLAELLARRADPGHDLPRLLRYFEAVCQAVGYAHSQGVIHRDLKPANVMVGTFGEVQVMDWGLAKWLDEGPEVDPEQAPAPPSAPWSTPLPARLTRPGAVFGTPGYLAPEQARGRAGDQRADVFGLGAILCEILTGAPAFRGADVLDLLQAARAGNLSDATGRLDRCGADPELVGLAKDCLAAAPARRPGDGGAVAARLAGHLAGVQERLRRAEVGQARAEARAEGERTRRRLAVGLAAAFLAVVALGGGTLLLVQRHRAEQAREQERRQQAAESALARAADLRQQGRWAAAVAVLEQAQQRLDERDGPVRRDVERAAAELQLVGRLEKVRLGAATWTGRSFAKAGADRDYESEFRAAGLGGPDEPAEVVAQRVRASGVRAALIAALDDWAVTTADRPRRDWAREVARGADEDNDWGRRLRARWADPAALAGLAREAPVDRLSPHLLGALALALDDREAVPLLRRAQAQYPGDFWGNFSLAQRLFVEQQYAEAAGFLRAALAARPDTPAVLINLGVVLKAQNKLEEACDCYQRALALDPGCAYAHNNLGSALLGLKRPAEAVACFRKGIEIDPTDGRAHASLGEALAGMGQLDEAVACYRKALELDPTDGMTHYNLGLALRAQAKSDEAIECYQRAVALDPGNADAYTALGNALKAKGRVDQAIECFQKAIALNRTHAMAHNGLGNALLAKGKSDEAIECLRRAIALDPNDAMPHYNLGNALRARGRLDEAVACWQRAIELDPTLARAHGNLGAALLTRRQLDEAIACLRRAIELAPNDAMSHYNLGTALADKGQVDEAIACLRQSVALNPKYAQAHTNLGHALQAKGQLDQAITCYRRAIELAPRLAQAHGNLGTALQAKGQLDQAIACYRRAIEIDANFPEAHCGLGRALQARGDFAEAMGPLRRGHELGSKRGDWKHDSAAWVRECERLVEREKQLLDVLAGRSEPAGAGERIEWARLCVQTRRYAAAARLSGEAFGADGKLANDLEAGHRYRAATAAALAGVGQGRDAGNLTNEARAALRRQALDWLKADLAAWRSHSEESQRARALRDWRADKALAVVRDEEGLAKLPPAERAAWGEFWAEVEKLLKLAR